MDIQQKMIRLAEILHPEEEDPAVMLEEGSTSRNRIDDIIALFEPDIDKEELN